ncbi:MAG: DUF4145 domain-containing protein [Candidatus Rokuibacteriota bacterium]|jgi:hypothetical protein
MSDSLPIREVILRDFEALIAFCESLLSDAKEKFPNRVRSAELMLRARNLIRRACGEGSEHYRVLLELARIDQPAAYVPRLQGVLLAAASDFREGRFFEFRHVIEAEVLGSFIDQAEALLAAGHHLPAASLTGAVLERALRKLCEARGITPPSASTIDTLNTDLAQAGAYSTRSQERITVLAALRDSADQGKAEAVPRDDVEGMARWVRAFAADSLG